MTNTTLVSIVVPCHDLGHLLEEAVDSVFAQTWPEIEIVVVDDDSTDPHTRRVLSGYDWPRTRVVRLPRRGAAAALDAGVEASRGGVVGILDPHHALEPTYVQKAVALLDADPSLTLATCLLRRTDETVPPIACKGLAFPDLLVSCTVGPAALVRRDAILEAGGFDRRLDSGSEAEWDLWITLAERGARSAVIPEALVRLGPAASVLASAVRGERTRGLVVDKHRESYARHHLEVLAGQWSLVRELAALNEDLAEGAAQPTAEAGAIAAEKASALGHSERIAALEKALREAEDDVRALRTSASWRVTAPLRAAHAWLSRGRSGPRQS